MKEQIEQAFTNTYDKRLWEAEGSRSGLGSSLEYTKNIRVQLLKLVKELKVKTILDLSCGDWFWMKEIKDELPTYKGLDVVNEMIEVNKTNYQTDTITFQKGDMLEELKSLKAGEVDLIICRQTLEHLPSDYVEEVLSEIRRVGKYALITSVNTTTINEMIGMDGYQSRPINLDESPYKEIIGTPINRVWDSIMPELEKGCFMNLYHHPKPQQSTPNKR
jgi:2-polyprenyl-3-methyl-5-hydroxy-6-metoxy-1,4-benzoquinol methylase